MTTPSAWPLIRVVYQSTSLIRRMEGAFGAELAFAADHLSVLSVPLSDTPADVRQRFHQPSAYA